MSNFRTTSSVRMPKRNQSQSADRVHWKSCENIPVQNQNSGSLEGNLRENSIAKNSSIGES